MRKLLMMCIKNRWDQENRPLSSDIDGDDDTNLEMTKPSEVVNPINDEHEMKKDEEKMCRH